MNRDRHGIRSETHRLEYDACSHRQDRPALRRFIAASATAVIAALALTDCGGGTDLSVGQQDITFTVALGTEASIAQGSSGITTAEVRDEDRPDTDGNLSPAEREPFTARVDLRVVTPLPAGVGVSFSRNPVAPGEVASMSFTADADAAPGRYQLLVAGTISGGSTTRYFPHVLTVNGNCAIGTEAIGDIAAGDRTVFIARGGAASIAGFNVQRDEASAAGAALAPQALDLYTARRVPELPAVASAATQPLSRLSAFVTAQTGGLRVLSRYYQSGVGAPGGVPGWAVEAVRDRAGFVQVVANRLEFHALHGDGTVWRFNASVREDDGAIQIEAPVQVAGLGAVTRLAAGYEHVLALRNDGTILAFGFNSSGQLGDGTDEARTAPAPVIGLANATAIAAGQHHSLALRADGTVWAWGNNGAGQLGDRSTTERRLPVQVARLDGTALDGVLAIASGYSHAMALRVDGSVWSWGDGVRGQHGDGVRQSRPAAAPVDSVRAERVAAGANNSFAIGPQGTVLAWGENDNGSLADGTRAQRAEPARSLGLGSGEGVRDCRTAEPPSQPGLVFDDLQFGAGGWQVLVTSMPIDGLEQSVLQSSGGGNPGAFRRMTHAMTAAPGIELLLRVVHLKLDAVYDPARSGAIDRIDYREDRIRIASETERPQGVSAGLAIRQGDRLFVPIVAGDGGGWP